MKKDLMSWGSRFRKARQKPAFLIHTRKCGQLDKGGDNGDEDVWTAWMDV